MAAAVDGRLLGPAGRLTVSRVSTDSRTIRKNDLFVALRGENHDGHFYLDQVMRAGAKAAIVEARNPLYERFHSSCNGFPVIEVTDALKALGDLAAWVREGLDIEVVGITGSTGKTCTKDFVVAALSAMYAVAASPGSYNNEIGAPLTVFKAGTGHQVMVCEMGARRRGDIERLAGIVKPGTGIITNIGPSHLGVFGAEKDIAQAKAELAEALPGDGTLFLNSGDRWSNWIAKRTEARVIRFGEDRGALYRASRVRLDPAGRPSFLMTGPGFRVEVELLAAGRHQVLNALAASACAHRMGVPPEEIAVGLKGASVSAWRLEVTETGDGCTVINDSYNANPDSMKAALEALSSIGAGRRKIAVLGGMAELGSESKRFHEEVGRRAVEYDVDLLVAIGRGARDYARAANESGLPRGSAFRCEDTEEARVVLCQVMEPGDVVLVKASRVYGFESLAASLTETGCGGSRRKAAPRV